MSGLHDDVSYTISGHKVYFPGKPYPSQLSMMSRVVQGLEKGENCLLESPTGSGKSLALLCSALAWQASEYEKAKQEASEGKGGCFGDAGDVADGFTDIEDAVGPASKSSGDSCCGQEAGNCQTTQKARKVPKIWFGTRTHKQIAQIAREMGKTHYKNCNMTILASREHTCIDPIVSSKANKNEECKSKLDLNGCSYQDRVKRVISQSSIKNQGLNTAWDLDNFKSFCKRNRACAYFGSRELKTSADIVFCPYNYLIDPKIRSSMEISLKGQIVILDEAHNIEDASREAASYSMKESQLAEASTDIRHLIDKDLKPDEHRKLLTLMEGFSALIEKQKDKLGGGENDNSRNFDTPSVVWQGLEMVAMLGHAGLGDTTQARLMQCLTKVTEDEGEGFGRKREPPPPRISNSTLSLLEGLLLTAKFIYSSNMKHMPDYRMALVRSMMYVHPNNQRQTDGMWLGRKKNQRPKLEMTYTLHFWCLNPAVAFEDMGGVTRSVVVTSGTLSPLSSFQSELGTPFPIQLEANHVISGSQLWVGAISQGPQGASLLGSYQNSETLSYQDNLGELVLSVCQTVPHGVLCFLPSYKSLQKLSERWQATGLWSRVEEHKQVFSEPRSSKKEEFEDTMTSFYQAIETSGSSDDEAGGALFLAVCRGKVSEGLDFADNNARAVIAVGIPYPNYRDTQVELKQKYNNENSSRGLLNGRDWYEIQAFRALNQALGRCIRHRRDWGALILVDDRYAKNPNKYTKGLSRWIRQKVKYYSNFNHAKSALERFTKERKETDIEEQSFMASQQSPGSTSRLDMTLNTLQPDKTMNTPHKPPRGFTSPASVPHMASTTPIPSAKPTQPQIVVEQNIRVRGTATAIESTLKRLARTVDKVTMVKTEESTATGTVNSGQYLLLPSKAKSSSAEVSYNTDVQNLAQLLQGNEALKSPQSLRPDNPQDVVKQDTNGQNVSQAGGFLLSSQLLSTQTSPPASSSPDRPSSPANHHPRETPSRDVMQGELMPVVAGAPWLAGDPTPLSSQIIFNPSFTSTQVVRNTADMDQQASDNPSTMFSCVPNADINNIKTVEPSKINCDNGRDHSRSPLLFDSEKNPGFAPSPKHVVKAIKEEVVQPQSVKRKPLFRRSDNKSASTAAQEADPMKVLTPSKQCNSATNTRLAALLNIASIEPTLECNQEAEETYQPDVTATAYKREVVAAERKDLTLTECKQGEVAGRECKAEPAGDEEEDPFSCTETSLKTRRLSRNKRRRSSGKIEVTKASHAKRQKAKGVDFEDEASSEKQLRCYTCVHCGNQLACTADANRETFKPSFMQGLLKTQTKCQTSHLLVMDVSELGERIQPLSTDTEAGVCLNSVWETGMCIQYVQCSHCVTSSPNTTQPVIGAHLLFSTDTHPRIKPSQVWILTGCVSEKDQTVAL